MSSIVHIREALPGDEAALAHVGAATFLESFAGIIDGGDVLAHCQRQHAAEVYAGWLADGAWKIWLATVEPGEAPVGYLAFGPAELPLVDLGDGDWEVKRIYVLGRFRGGGVGCQLMELAKSEVRRRGGRRLLVGVYARNEGAIAFYRREGFVEVGEREFLVGARRYRDLVMGAGIG